MTPSARLSWTAPADGERAGFEVLWRETTEPRWSVLETLGPAPLAAGGEAGGTPDSDIGATGSHHSVVLEGVSTDNRFFAVRAAGLNGARSLPVAATLKPPQPKP